MQTQTLNYQDQDTLLQGFYAYDEKGANQKPLILIAHDWTGCNDFARGKAKKLAELGYVGFALDVYGNGKLGSTKEEKSALMQPLMSDRKLLLRRMQAALSTAKNLPMVDAKKIAVMGFCFGGLCALDLARSGVDIQGTISFHGLLMQPEDLPKNKILAKILAFHGYDDPMGLPMQMQAFAQEMTQSQADWQIHIYGNTMHAFTNPAANDKDSGLLYEAKADHRSWQALKDFLQEIFG